MTKSLPRLLLLAAFVAVCFALANAQVPEQTADSGASELVSPVPATTAVTMDTGLAPVQMSPPQDDARTAGNALIVQSAAQLERRASVAAKLRHQVCINGQQLYGVGAYWQQGAGEDLKTRLELQIAGQDAQLLQVCNGRAMWIDRKLPTGRSVSRIDLRELRADPAVASSNLNDLRPGEASWSGIQSELIMYTGGLPTLLAALHENFDFMPPQALRLALTPPLTPEPTTVPVWAVVGHWKPERLEQLLSGEPLIPPDNESELTSPPPKKRKKRGLHKVPERMPEEVLVLVGQADYFPYRIEYRHLETPDANSEGAVIPYQTSTHPLVVLELSDVVFDAQIAAGQFDYSPSDANWENKTTSILKVLRQRHQQQVATRTQTSEGAPLTTRQ